MSSYAIIIKSSRNYRQQYLSTYICIKNNFVVSAYTDDDSDTLSTPAVVGITFVITLIISVTLTLLIVKIAYKIKQSSAKNKESPIKAVNHIPLPMDHSTIKGTTSDYKANDQHRDHTNLHVPLMMNPAYHLEHSDGNAM